MKNFDINTLIGFLLIGLILVVWSIYTSPTKEEIEEQRRKRDSIIKVQRQFDSISAIKQKEEIDSIQRDEVKKVLPLETTGDGTEGDSLIKAEPKDRFGLFANASVGEEKIITLENELYRVFVSTKGGRIISVELKNYEKYDTLKHAKRKAKNDLINPLVLFDKENSSFNLIFPSQNKIISTDELYFKPNKTGFKVQEDKTDSISLRVEVDSARYIEYVYKVRGNQYMMDFDINFIGMEDVLSDNTNYIEVDWNMRTPRQEKSYQNEKNNSSIYYCFWNNDADKINPMKDQEQNLSTKIKWVSFKQQFFSSVLISQKDGFDDMKIKTLSEIKETDKYVKNFHSNFTIPYQNEKKVMYNLQFYFGPNHYQILKEYKLKLERQISIGWGFFLIAWINRFLVIPVFNFLDNLNINYGIIILLLKILIKIILFPIAYKTYISTAKMKVLKPQIDEINKKYPKPEDMMKKQQTIMALYRSAGVNPMAGCIPMLLQFPILYAMFLFFPASIELRQQPFLWADDLSTYDSILNLGFNIPLYGDHVSLFTILMTASMVIYTLTNQQTMGTQGTQMPGMKFMIYAMPVMFMGVMNNFSAGLSYYYFLANMVTFLQQWIIKRYFVDEEKILKKIREYQATPQSKKKSGFQRRLEELAKQRGYRLPKGWKR